MRPTEFLSIVVLALAMCSPLQVFAHSAEPFSAALETLQNQIEYTFENIGILRRAMTHASFSEENNKALGILGASVIESSIALKSLTNNVDISPKDLNRQISEICNVETSCAKDGSKWGLEKVVRVSPKTSSSTPAVVCGAFRAVIGAVALDTGSSEEAMGVFWKGHDGSRSRRANSK
jgi:dsRNA-specific ribonuclease